ncbi:hypothetical protein SEA_YDN12_40 [Streptomyces phage YDN12]|uniref:Uncharacterized protein n=1 Tax=Streptomyces phage YDN12 TaxID=1636183 RepID=A0A0E3JJD1_9CAUD|nr:hypothetical protein AVT63_gp39 [Streptomyces phage YDN12]AKA61707.1 hypothetical protein SEA_YDN12_40 [Streptomyces phage YDN12]
MSHRGTGCGRSPELVRKCRRTSSKLLPARGCFRKQPRAILKAHREEHRRKARP